MALLLRRRTILFIITFVTFIAVSQSDFIAVPTNMSVEKFPARYDNYMLWRVHIDTEEQLVVMQELERRNLGIEFIGHVRKTGQKLTLVIPARAVADLSHMLERYQMKNEVLVRNMQDIIDEQRRNVKAQGTPGSEMEWKNYYQLDSLYDYLDHVSGQYDFVTTLEIGKSYEGRAIKGIKISKNPGKTTVFIEGGIHAREWISPATTTFIINQLLTSTDPQVMDLLNEFDWLIFPVLNPDGYAYTFDYDRLWRKNRKPYGLCVGVDLNRNFDSNWNGAGSSGDPQQFDFAGSGPNSEPEVANLANFLREYRTKSRIETFISLHSYSQLIMFPYGHTEERVENYDDLKEIGNAAAAAIKKRHGKEYTAGSIIETIYPSSGGSSDWVYHALGIKLSYTIELRGTPESTEMFILPADQIIPVGEEVLDAFVAMFAEARTRNYFK